MGVHLHIHPRPLYATAVAYKDGRSPAYPSPSEPIFCLPKGAFALRLFSASFMTVTGKFRLSIRALFQVRTYRPPPLSFASSFMIDAHSAESNEKYNFRFIRFLFYELWLIVFTIYQKFTDRKQKVVQKC